MTPKTLHGTFVMVKEYPRTVGVQLYDMYIAQFAAKPPVILGKSLSPLVFTEWVSSVGPVPSLQVLCAEAVLPEATWGPNHWVSWHVNDALLKMLGSPGRTERHVSCLNLYVLTIWRTPPMEKAPCPLLEVSQLMDPAQAPSLLAIVTAAIAVVKVAAMLERATVTVTVRNKPRKTDKTVCICRFPDQMLHGSLWR